MNAKRVAGQLESCPSGIEGMSKVFQIGFQIQTELWITLKSVLREPSGSFRGISRHFVRFLGAIWRYSGGVVRGFRKKRLRKFTFLRASK